MKNTYSASIKRNPGRRSFVITFRHPLKMEHGRPGKKVFKGLGTEDVTIAEHWKEQMNKLLAREDLHSVGSRVAAEREFDQIVADIFYGDLDPSPNGHRALRDRLLPMPPMGPTAPVRTMLLGNSGVGKSALTRRFIGCNADNERFPAISANRTTTCDIEILTGAENFSGAVTFLSRNQTQQEVTESLSNAVLKAIEAASDEVIMKELLDDPDQRFRLKYTLGTWSNPKANVKDSLSLGTSTKTSNSAVENSPFLKDCLTGIRAVARIAREEVEQILGNLGTLKVEERSYALDEMQQAGESSESFQDLVQDIMEQIEARFVSSDGKFQRSPTGWPESWTWTVATAERDTFIKHIQWFCSNTKEEWGQLLTPLVTGIRVSGPFRPDWIPQNETYEHVFIDTQGLDHEKPATELSSETTSLFGQVQNILFIESGKDSLKSQSARKVMEAIAGSGHITKLSVVLTHMDLVVGDDIPTPDDRKIKAFAGLRSLIENEVSRNVSRDSAQQLAQHLDESTFYLAYVDPKRYPTDWDTTDTASFDISIGDDLWNISRHLAERAKPHLLQPSIPEYSFESLGLAVREVSVLFHQIWDARLGYKPAEGISSVHWQGVKAMSRRYAEGWFDGYWLRPIDTLISQTRNVLTRFLDSPLNWLPKEKHITDQEKRIIINRLQQIVNDELKEMSKSRLWKTPQKRWQSAYEPTGDGSTFTRKQRVHELFLYQIPIPQSISDRWAQEWIDEVKKLLQRAIDILRDEAEGNSK